MINNVKCNQWAIDHNNTNIHVKAKDSMVGMQEAKEILVKVVSQQFEFP